MNLKIFSKITLLLAFLAPSLLLSNVASYYAPLDTNADAFDGSGKKIGTGAIHGRSNFVDAISGKGIDVKRYAYDQVTAVNFNTIPPLECNKGTVSFWFKPNWKENDPNTSIIFSGQAPEKFRYYFIKGKNGTIELSVCAPNQIQILKRNILKKDQWAHVAFCWNTDDGSVRLYINGREVDNKINPTNFTNYKTKQPHDIWLGSRNGDRFKAVVGEGVYDEIKLFERVLSPAEIFAIASDGAEVEMLTKDITNIKTSENATDIVFSHQKARMLSPSKLFEVFGKSNSFKISVSTMGSSGKLSFLLDCDNKKSALESACIINLDTPHMISFKLSESKLGIFVDDSLQGEFPAPSNFGKIDSIKAIDGLTLQTTELFPSSKDTQKLKEINISKTENLLWKLDDASVEENGVRTGICLNGYWRVYPVNECSYAPTNSQWAYVRVPGSFRSPIYKLYKDTGEKLESLGESWQGKNIVDFRSAWYQRAFDIPNKIKDGERIFLNFKNLNGDYGRVYVNGKLVDSFRQDFKCFPAIPNARRIDITDIVNKDGQNLLTLFIDRAQVALWRGAVSIGDTSEIAIDDVWLEKSPSKLWISSSLALPSFRNKEVSLFVRIQNPSKERGKSNIKFTFKLDEKNLVSFDNDFELDGTKEQVVKFVKKWKNPILWNVENPNLYKLQITLSKDSKILDTPALKNFGFREVWVENGEFKLNGNKMRMRMWTSPSLERLRHYYGTKHAIGQYVAHVKYLNYDTIRVDPYGKNSQVGWDLFLNESDKQGLYNLFQMPPYEDEEIVGYSKQVARFLEYYGTHPSILMWYTDFNTCSYAWNQDPAKLTDTQYAPERLKHSRKRAQTAEKVMRSMDNSRELFQHAGGNSGKIFTSMNYQSFGTPLQEQEDWPAQWSKSHTQPLMVVERGFPYPAQFVHFDNPQLGTLAAEHAARFFGDDVYLKELSPIPNINESQRSPYANAPENLIRLSEMLYKNVAKAWRAYDVSALGDFPGGRDKYNTAITYDEHNVIYNIDNDVKTSGLKPDNPIGWSQSQRHLLTDYSRPAYLSNTIKETFNPLLIYLGGTPENFTNKDHSFYANEKFQKSIVVVNDKTTPQSLTFKWQLNQSDSPITLASGKISKTIEAGGIEKLPISIKSPDVYKRTNATLNISAFDSEGFLLKEDSMRLEFFPKRKQPNFSDASACLYDPCGKTESMLKSAGFPFKKIEKFEDIQDCRLLIIGQNALTTKPDELLCQIENSGLIEKGLKVLIFEQKQCNLANFVFESPSYRNAFIRHPESPYLSGLKEEDFSNWRGESDTVPAYVLSDENSPHYPRSKWKCGNGGIVSGTVIRKPSYGNFTTIVDCGFNLMFASLLELRKEHGLILFCQLDVTSRFGKDPAATKLVDNILSTMSNYFVPVGAQRVAYIGDAQGQKILDKMGMQYTALTPNTMWEMGMSQVIILGKSSLNPKQIESIHKFVENNPRVAIVALPEANLQALSGNFKIVEKELYKATPPKSDPLFAGITNADLYFRNPQTLPIVESSQDWIISTSPALFSKLDRITGASIVFAVAPEDVKGIWNSEKITRVWSTIFNNMNIGMGKDLKLFSNKKYRHNLKSDFTPEQALPSWSPYIDNIDFYDGDAFHNW